MKNILKIFLTIFLMLSLSKVSFAQEEGVEDLLKDFEVSGDFGATSNYVFRSISQTGDRPAIQGSLSFDHKDSGLHFGLWGSSVDFKIQPSSQESIELDYTVGYKTDFDDISVDLGFIYYDYPGAISGVSYDFNEYYIDLSSSYGDLEYGNSLNYSDDYFAGSGESYYYNAYLSYKIDPRLTLNGSIGYQELDNEVTFGFPDYVDWLAGLSYSISNDLSVDVSYTDNNMDDQQCSGACGEKVTASLLLSL